MRECVNYFIKTLKTPYVWIVIFCLLTPFLFSSVYAQFPQRWEEIENQPGRCVQKVTIGHQTIEVATIQGFECLFINIIRILVPVVGLIFFIMLIVGSFQLLTSGGEAKAAQKARLTFTYAIFGLGAFFGIWFILKLIQVITGVDVTKFVIPGPL